MHVGVRLKSPLADSNGVGLTSCPESADIDVIAAGGEIASSIAANGNVVISAVIEKRLKTVRRVVGTVVEIESKGTRGGILGASAIGEERRKAGCRIVAGVDVVLKRTGARGRVGGPGIEMERSIAVSCVEAAAVIDIERLKSGRRVSDTGCIAVERTSADRRVFGA